MANVYDVALYILNRCGPMPAVKLQKLVYYCQAWSLVWDGEELYHERIEAWANGPVVPALYQKHRRRYKVEASLLAKYGDVNNLSVEQKETIEAVLSTYSGISPYGLSQLTHNEKPWIDAREGLDRWDRGRKQISLVSMAEYYEALANG